MFIQVKIYREGTNYGDAMRLQGTAFVPSGNRFVKILLVWGMEPRDFSECHKTGYECTGHQVWDNMFDMNNAPVQLALQVKKRHLAM